jgi:NADPH-dependent curcumin reductase CurA
MDLHTALHLIARPEGEPRASDLELRSQPAAALADGQIRVAVRWVSIDPAMRIWMSEQKSYWPPIELGDVMRAAGIGEVIESRHPKFPVGTWLNGMMGVQNQVVTDGRGLRPFDPRLLKSPTDALGALGATGLTAYFGLKDIGKPKAGETLVVSAAAGAVGSSVVQIGKQWGLKVIGIAGGPQKCAYVKDELGADGVIDYKSEKIGAALSRLAPEGVDVYFDNVGGEILEAVLRRLRMHARIVLCGGISQYNAKGAAQGPANYLALISARARMEGFVVIDYLHRTDEAYAEMLPWLHAGSLKSKTDEVVGIEHFIDALNRVLTGANFGKQVLKIV